jgi:hypothetical protein
VVESEEVVQVQRTYNRTPPIPFPVENLGQPTTGIVSAIIRKGRIKFGFIHVGDGSKPNHEVPKIYFSFSNLKDTSLIIRKGYKVAFVGKKDDKGRSYAGDIELTEEGKEEAVQRESVIAQKRLENPTEYKPRTPRVFKEKNVNLKVTIEGSNEFKTIPFNVNLSVGRLKSTVLAEFNNASLTLSVYLILAGAPSKTLFLTRQLLFNATENDTILLAERKQLDAEA